MKNIEFLSKTLSQICLLQSNPNFYGSENSKKIHKYSRDPKAAPRAKIFQHFLEYFCYRKSVLFWIEMVVSTATTILLGPFDLIFLVHSDLSNSKLASKAQLQTPSQLTTVTSQSYCPETYQTCKILSTAPGSKPNHGKLQNYHEQHARDDFWTKAGLRREFAG